MLSDLKSVKQRNALKEIGLKLIEISENFEEDDIEILLDHIELGVLDPLDGEDFFGSSGWKDYFGL